MKFNFIVQLSYSESSFSDLNEAIKLLSDQISDFLGDSLTDEDNEDNVGKDLLSIDIIPLVPLKVR